MVFTRVNCNQYFWVEVMQVQQLQDYLVKLINLDYKLVRIQLVVFIYIFFNLKFRHNSKFLTNF